MPYDSLTGLSFFARAMVYDGTGRLVERSQRGRDTIDYFYLGANLLSSRDVNQSTVYTDYLYAGSTLVARTVSGLGTYYYHSDVQGSTRFTTSGGITATSQLYTAFGAPSSAGGEALLHSGKLYDTATGLYFFGTRFYDPTVGRFVQQDTFSGVLSNPLSFNKYAYAGDSPMTFSDNSGMAWWNDWWNGLSPGEKAGVAVGAGIAIGVAICLTVVGCFGPAEAAGAGVAGIGLSGAAIAGGGAVVGGGEAIAEDDPGLFSQLVESVDALVSRGVQRVAVMEEDMQGRVLPFKQWLESYFESKGMTVTVDTFEPSEAAWTLRSAGDTSLMEAEDLGWLASEKALGVPILDLGPAGQVPTRYFYIIEDLWSYGWENRVNLWGTWS